MHQVSWIFNDQAFYPIGNTPAVNLLSYHSCTTQSSDEPRELLLLACGDVRNILYTVWCENQSDLGHFNFTCCDIEPAILARNIIVLSLMLDKHSSYEGEEFSLSNEWAATIWNLQYHYEISQKDAKVLKKQVSKLLLLSQTVEEWVASPYACIQFVSLQSIREVRKIWERYVEVKTEEDQAKWDLTRRKGIATVFKKAWSNPGMSTTFTMGVHFDPGLEQANIAFRKYWKTGVLAVHDDDVQSIAGSNGRVNPLFVITSFGDSFKVHSGTSPLASFHLAEVFDRDMDDRERVKAIALTAKTQFYQWTRAFVARAKKGSLSIRMYLGDAINFCHALTARNTAVISSSADTRLYTSPWLGDPLLLDGPGAEYLPKTFDVIDCSNLSDFTGLLNLLPVTSLLLSRKARSVLYTESLRLSDDHPHKDLAASLYMDIGLASLLFGIVPVGSLLSYSTENSFPENLTHVLAQIHNAGIYSGRRRFRMRVPWRFAVGGDEYARATMLQPKYDHRVELDAEGLTGLIFKLYMTLFFHEDLNALQKKYPLGEIFFQDYVLSRYARLSLVTVLQVAKNNILTDWKKFFGSLAKRISEEENLTYGTEGRAEFMFRLHESGIWEEEEKDTPAAAAIEEMIKKDMALKFLTLTVPRSALKTIQKAGGGTPGFHLVIMSLPGAEGHTTKWFSMDCCFGKVIRAGDETTPVQILEDPLGWQGSSDLIVTTSIPMLALKYTKPSKCLIGLGVTFNLSTMSMIGRLGPDMLVYKTRCSDKKHVFQSKLPPDISVNHPTVSKRTAVVSISEAADDKRNMGSAGVSASHVNGETSLVSKYSMTAKSREGTALAAGAIVTLTCDSPCSILIKIGLTEQHRLIFPFPIDGAKAKTRIARKSLWIEVTVPMSLFPSRTGGYGYRTANPFPIGQEGTQPYAWSIPRCELSKQPRVDPPGQWIDNTWTQFLSERESKICDKLKVQKTSTVYLDLLLEIKLSVMQMICHVTGFYVGAKDSNFAPLKVIALVDDQLPPSVLPEIFIFASCVRHLREDGGLVLDAYLVELGRPSAKPAMLESAMEFRPVIYKTSAAELALWKKFLPAAMESCRTGWIHSPNCVFCRDASTVTPEYILCDCGLGKDVDGFPFGKESSLAGFSRVATRLALPMLSSVSYVETMRPEVELAKKSQVEAKMWRYAGVPINDDDPEWEDEE